MKNRNKILVALALAGLLALSIAGIAFAQGPANQTNPPYGQGVCGLDGGVCTIVSELTGLTADEIHELREDGQSLAQIAATKGVSEDALVAAIMEAKTAAIQARVQDGTLTQERANVMLQQMEQATRQAVTSTGIGSGAGNCYGRIGQGENAPGKQLGRCGGNFNQGQTGTGMGPGMMGRWARTN